MAKQNANIEVIEFTKSDIGPEKGTIVFEYYNVKLKANITISADAYEVSKWAAENKLGDWQKDEMINGSHEYSAGSLDPWVWVAEAMEAEQFIDYLKEQGVI